MFKTTSSNNTQSKSNDAAFLAKASSSSFIQPKLNIGKSGDKYEVEADRMADQVVAKTNDQSVPFFAPAPTIQKQNNEDLQTQQEDTLQEKPLSESITPLIQTSTEEEVQEKTTEDVPEETIQQKAEDSALKTAETPDTRVAEPNTPIQKAVEENIQEKEEEEIQEKEDEEVQQLQIQSSGGDENPSSDLENNLNSSKGGGSPLSSDTRQEMESGFGADFSGVRVHNDSNATQMNQQLGSQAFANGSDIYFNEGKYNPDSNSGKHLLAHELTHTVQQGGASIQRKSIDISSVPEMIQGFGFLDLVPDWIIDNARNIPGYTLFTVIITYDPLTGRNVDRTAINLVQGLLELVPIAGPAIFDKLQEYGILETAFDWISGKLSELNLTSDGILSLVEEAWNELEFPYTDAIDIIAGKFDTLLNRVIRFASALIEQLLTWVKDALIDVAEPYLEENQAWSLIKKVIHYDPLRGEEVQAETVEILEDFLILIGKETELEQMRERDTLQETADWLDTQIGAFMTLLGQLNNLVDNVWDAIQPENLPNILDNLGALATSAGEFLEGVWDFASTVAIEVLKLIKDSLLSWLNTFAADIPGFTLLTVIIRKNPLTDEEVPRSVQNIIRGFMGLVPGGEARYQELTESGVIPRAAGQIEALIAQLGMSPASIIQLFTDLWNSFTIDDLLDPLAAFERITATFGEPISRLFQFVAKVVKILVNLLLEIMGIPPELIGNIIANIMSAFEDIKRDPIGFLLNLMNALKNGFINFLNNIGTHLLNGIQTWLFGTLADAGVDMPEDLSIRSLLGMAMDVLGITIDNVLDRLAEKIGPERMEQIRSVLDTLTGIWAFVKDVIERGPIAIWEYIQDQISNLWNVIKEGIMGFIQEKVIQQAIGWLLSFLDVTGIMPIIRGVQTVFNAITSFIEKLREILGIVNSFVAGVADIARGSIQSAASFLETALADGIPVAISFLAKQLGLGDISEKIAEMIENTREMINEGIDWLIDKALEAGTAFLNALGLGGNDAEEESETGEEENAQGEIGEEIPFQIGQENHRIWIKSENGRAVVMMASNEDEIENQLTEEEKNTTEGQELISKTNAIEREATTLNQELIEGTKTTEQIENEDNHIETEEEALIRLMQQIKTVGDADNEEYYTAVVSDENAVPRSQDPSKIKDTSTENYPLHSDGESGKGYWRRGNIKDALDSTDFAEGNAESTKDVKISELLNTMWEENLISKVSNKQGRYTIVSGGSGYKDEVEVIEQQRTNTETVKSLRIAFKFGKISGLSKSQLIASLDSKVALSATEYNDIIAGGNGDFDSIPLANSDKITQSILSKLRENIRLKIARKYKNSIANLRTNVIENSDLSLTQYRKLVGNTFEDWVTLKFSDAGISGQNVPYIPSKDGAFELKPDAYLPDEETVVEIKSGSSGPSGDDSIQMGKYNRYLGTTKWIQKSDPTQEIEFKYVRYILEQDKYSDWVDEFKSKINASKVEVYHLSTLKKGLNDGWP